MASKENKGGVLTNKQVENDNKVKGKNWNNGQLEGAQDTGDKVLRSEGNEVQREDGFERDKNENGNGR